MTMSLGGAHINKLNSNGFNSHRTPTANEVLNHFTFMP